ncbi:hypothetical protein ACF1CG_10915 [Streptomyces sp. NPDC014773]|uniref:hypothetical protein n=1 Tax=Streptomyces sp. NPDC014773 TaxID=3364908 RepID=UPI003702F1C3
MGEVEGLGVDPLLPVVDGPQEAEGSRHRPDPAKEIEQVATQIGRQPGLSPRPGAGKTR